MSIVNKCRKGLSLHTGLGNLGLLGPLQQEPGVISIGQLPDDVPLAAKSWMRGREYVEPILGGDVR